MTPAQIAEWLRGFALPLVAGGDVRIHAVLGQSELDALLTASLEVARVAGEVVGRIGEARHAVAAELVIGVPEPDLDADAIRLAVAVHDLLFLSHPGTRAASVRKGRLADVARWAAGVAQLPPPDSARELAYRHSMLHHLFDLGRDDVRVSFWAGRREFKGAEPPARLLKWQEIRRVREERWRVSFLTEAVTDPGQRAIVTALLEASPLTDLLEPLRLEPPLELARLATWLRDPAIARAVADRYLTLGFPQIAGPLSAALIQLYNTPDRGVESRLATAFFCHLHLLQLVSGDTVGRGAEPTPAAYAPAMLAVGQRDFYGLFAAAQRVGVGRPLDLGRDPRLARAVDAYTTACTNLCGPARVVELEGVMARGVQQMLLASG
jgi:hypothetical protein